MENSTVENIPAGEKKQPELSKYEVMVAPGGSTMSGLSLARLSLLLALAAIFLSACTPKTAEVSLPLAPPETFLDTGEAELPAKWWTAFDDQELNVLIRQALDSNFNLQTAWYRFQAARAVVERESSFLWPQAEASLQVGKSYPEPDFRGGENLRFGLLAFYEVDLWGRIGATVAAERFRAEASLFDYQAASLSLAAEVARSWYGLVAARQQLALVEEQIENNLKILRLIRARVGIGQTRAVDLLRQQQLIEATREQKLFAEARIELLEHQLAILLGIPPQQEVILLPDSFPALPPLPQAGIPAELIRRRPDVLVAFKLLQAADREVAAAISNKYPRFSLSVSPSVRANNAEALFQDWAYTLATNIAAPLFYGGRLRAEVNRAQAVKNQRLYEWGQAVLVAFREVEDALVQEQKQLEIIAVLEEQLVLAEQAYEQLQLEYLNGITDYLAVLTALDQAQELRRKLIAARLNLLEYRIALYRALAGGFELEEEALEE